MSKFFRRKVQKGQKLGRIIGFPTINLRVGNFGDHVRQGVYVCNVWYREKKYDGLMHFGPKMGQRKKALEIYIHRFQKIIYGEWVVFEVGKKIREVEKMENISALKKQIKKDSRTLQKTNRNQR